MKNDRVPFRYIVLAVLAIIAIARLWLFPYWESQLRHDFQKCDQHPECVK
jgi:hypothetical protein